MKSISHIGLCLLFSLTILSCDHSENQTQSTEKEPVQTEELTYKTPALIIHEIEEIEEVEESEEQPSAPSLPEMTEPDKFNFISEFFKPLTEHPTRFDKYLSGESSALTPQEQRGLFKFVAYGCAGCHEGSGVGGERTEKLGIMEPYKYQNDTGLYETTKNEEDMYMFKVPSLRNVTQTPPYFHDGKISNISEAIKEMAKIQLGFELTEEDVADMVVFLGSLSD